MTTPGRHGGYRQPARPAPVSGPAQLSRRTDGGPGSERQPIRVANGGGYGDRKASIEQQQGAPLAKTPDVPGVAAPSVAGGGESAQRAQPAQAPPPLTGLGAPSTRPHEPVTAGAPWGPGPGPAPDGVNVEPNQLSQALMPYAAADDTGYIRLLINDLAQWGI